MTGLSFRLILMEGLAQQSGIPLRNGSLCLPWHFYWPLFFNCIQLIAFSAHFSPVNFWRHTLKSLRSFFFSCHSCKPPGSWRNRLEKRHLLRRPCKIQRFFLVGNIKSCTVVSSPSMQQVCCCAAAALHPGFGVGAHTDGCVVSIVFYNPARGPNLPQAASLRGKSGKSSRQQSDW